MILFENQALSPDKFLSCEPHLVQSVPPGPGQDAEVVKRPGHVSVSSAIAEECLVVIVNGETPPSGDKSREQWQQDEDESLKDSHFPRGPPLLLLLFFLFIHMNLPLIFEKIQFIFFCAFVTIFLTQLPDK